MREWLNYRGFREQVLECIKVKNRFDIKCAQCNGTEPICKKYQKRCSSKVCREERRAHSLTGKIPVLHTGDQSSKLCESTTFVVKSDWREDRITRKQHEAISNMRSALGWHCETPKTKGEASDLITEMRKEINIRLSLTGKIGYAPEFDSANEVDEEDRELSWWDDVGEEF